MRSRFDVFDGFGQDVEPVPELVELLPGHDQLVFAEAQLGGPAAGFVVALAAGTLAVLAGPAGAGGGLERAAAPSAPSRVGFRLIIVTVTGGTRTRV